MNGWFPKLSSDGQHVISGSGALWLDGRDLGIVGWEPQWWDAQHILYNGGPGKGLQLLDLASMMSRQLARAELSGLACGSGKWGGYDGRGSIVLSDGSTIPGAYQVAIAPDGSVLVRHGDEFIDPSVGLQSKAYVAGGAVVWQTLDGSVRHDYPGELGPCVIDTPDGPWLLSLTQTTLRLRPLSDPARGYEFHTGENNNLHPHGLYLNGAIAFVCCTGGGDLVSFTQPVAAPRVALNQPGAPPAQPPPAQPPAPAVQPPPPQESARMDMPDAVKSIIARFVAAVPVPSSGPNPSDDAFDNRCRAWVLQLAQQIRFETNDPKWGVKNAGGGRPQSKDSITYNGDHLYNFDVLSGVGTGTPHLVLPATAEVIDGQEFMAVQPANVLGGAPPVQPPPVQPPPVQPPDDKGAEMMAMIVDLATRVGNLEAEKQAQDAKLAELEARPAAAIPHGAPVTVKVKGHIPGLMIRATDVEWQGTGTVD